MTTEQALLKLAESTAVAVEHALELLAPGAVERGRAAVVPRDVSPLGAIPTPAVAVNVSYVDGVTGGNVFVMTTTGAQRLAAAMVGDDPTLIERGAELTELELSAVGEAMNQMMSAASGATSSVLSQDVEISAPAIHFFATAEEAVDAFERVPHATTVSFSVAGEPCRLIQLVPNSFVVRMTRAYSELEAETVVQQAAVEGALPHEAVRAIPVRVWAELGRARLPLGQAVGLPAGSVLELDRAAEEPVDLYVNGRRFATGRLLVTESAEWAVRIDNVLQLPEPAVAGGEGGE